MPCCSATWPYRSTRSVTRWSGGASWARRCRLTATAWRLRSSWRRPIAAMSLAEALQAYRDSLATREQLARAEPDNAQWQRDVAVSHSKLAMAAALRGERGEALSE